MPIIQINMFEGRTVEQKRKLVAEVTQAVVNSLGIEPERVRIMIHDMPKHDFGIAGVLAVDR
jgi:4-oxalocrotonate tautomerase